MSRGGGGGDGVTEQDTPPATSPRGRSEDAPSRSPSLPVVAPEKKKKLMREHEQQPSAELPDDVLIEILSRVGYKSLCRFKCVSRPWLDLCSGLDIRKRRSPQTLSGLYFFGQEHDEGLQFHDLAGGAPPLFNAGLSFLASYHYQRYSVEKCCGGLLLCMCWKPRSVQVDCDYVVCNPATDKCTVLPAIEVRDRPETLRLVGGHLCDIDLAERFLGFDTANPSNFVVVVPLAYYFDVIGELAIYSSETGRWTFALNEWSRDAMVRRDQPAIFLNGIIHLTTFDSSIVTVDREGKIWREIKAPCVSEAIGLSQGCLHTWSVDDCCQLFVWVLEDYASGKWTLKHTANVLGLFGRHSCKDDSPTRCWQFIQIIIHFSLLMGR
uniref:Uncharacterized protein n=1 Tax=Aegilops tauschii TaxID=37682 RepID=M8BHD1_AEGTA